MTFVANSKWKTRDGSEAIIDTVNPETYGSYYNIFGSVNGKSMSWDARGYMYAGGNQLDAFDLVECISSPPPPDSGPSDSLEYFRSRMFG
jgi:hypothetical protein